MAVRYPIVPQTITVHLGKPSEDARNITVPFIDYTDFYNFLDTKDISVSSNLILKGNKSSWPIMAKKRIEYDNYQLYLNEKMPLKWHFEKFLYPEMFYITIHLK